EKEIFDHAPGEVDFTGAKQSANDEVAVPSVHFVEAAAGNDIGVLEIEKPWRAEGIGVDLTEVMEDLGERFHFDVAARFKGAKIGRDGEIGRNVEDGFCGEFGIDDGGAVVHRAGEGVPASGDVIENGFEAGGRRGGLLSVERLAESQDEEGDQQANAK